MQAQLWTISGLAVELGKDRRTLAREIDGLRPDLEEEDKAGRITRSWKMARVVAYLCDRLDANAERARKDKEAADKIAYDNAVTRRELIRLSEADAWYGAHVERCQRRLIQIPDALGQFVEPSHRPELVAQARRLVCEAIEELAADGAEIPGEDSFALGDAAEVDGEPVGGSQAAAIQRGKRRAGTVAN